MTIFALSSGKGRAGVSVIRLSGAEVCNVISILCPKREMPKARRAKLRWFFDPASGQKLDRGLLIYFAAPHSFTGEDVAEFHIHGGYAVVEGFLNALSNIENVRHAEPGEFTRRAFDNGKMDLTAAEGLADLINAETQSQRRQALRQMDGKLATLYEGWRNDIIGAMAYLEADIDFSDQEIPDDVTGRIRPIVETLYDDIAKHLEDGHRGERLRHGLQVVILGAPNVGKSTLLNYLSKRDVAIVSDIAGTTRDLLEVHMDMAGFPVTIVDTAGLRQSNDQVEVEGVRRAESRAKDADLKLLIIDRKLNQQMIKHIDGNTMVLFNKCDLGPVKDNIIEGALSIGCWQISAKTGQGLGDFLKALEQQVASRMELTDTPSITRSRHRAHLCDCQEHLQRFLEADHSELELLSEDLRLAARSLGKITGYVDVEDILDKIFKEFCIGK